MARKKEEIKEIIENISLTSLDQVMADDYSIYAKDVIKNRAIPDARDGMKPVQRRIVFSMYENGNLWNKPTKKSARIVGDVMGKYHPHGDSSIYEALARLSQDWKMNMRLVEIQGNNGSIDGDGPAAARYTEARLTKLGEELISGIDKNSVDMVYNFDDTELEPVVLPARFPNLYLNGTEGIAVGMATDIPPHNLKELIDAAIYRINNPQCSIEELLEFVKGPDFPTGGKIINSDGLKDIYLTGKGKIDIRSTYEIKEEKDVKQIEITEIPFRVVKKSLVYEIDKIRQSKEIDGIIDVIDATEMHKISILINLKKDADAEKIINYLMQKTQLQTSYSSNIVAIVEGRPKLLNLADYLDCYINHQRDVKTRILKFDLEKDQKRYHIIQGLIKSISILDEVIQTIKISDNKQDAKNNLIAKYEFSEEQAEAIVNLQLYKLSHTDITKLNEECNDLEKEIKHINSLLSSSKKLDNQIIVELQLISSTYSVDRKTEILDNFEKVELNKRDLITKEDIYVAITRDGYIKRSSLKSYKTSLSILPGVKEGDCLECADLSNTLDYLLAFTNKGNYIFVPSNEIQDSKWKDEGKHINYICNLPFDEKIIKVLGVEDFIDGVYIATVSKKGQIKKTELKEFLPQRYSKPISCMKLSKDDELADVAITTGNSDLLIINSNGASSLFNENELTPLGNKTGGVKSINNLKGGKIIKLISILPDSKCKMILLTDKGCLRIADSSNVEKTSRLGKITYLFKTFKSDIHNLVSVLEINKDIKIEDDKAIIYYLNDKNIQNTIEVNDFHLTPMDKYAKTNIELNDNELINQCYKFYIDYIRKDTKVFKCETIEKEIIKVDENEESSDDFVQISIFDELGD